MKLTPWVEQNVLYDVRGAGIYIEDGNEMFNMVKYNIAVCPWIKGASFNADVESPHGAGCAIPGTDNFGTDSDSFVGIWSISPTNYLIGNRVPNYYNGIFVEVQRNGGQGRAEGQVCAQHSAIVGFEGNTAHGAQRFGTYLHNDVSPRHISQSVENNGFADLATCDVVWLDDGENNGWPMKISNNVDYGSVFVGGYGTADMQFEKHTSIECNNGIYWKNTKNFADGCSAHIRNDFFLDTHLAMPDASAFIVQDTVFKGRTDLESGHHCGALCFGHYVFQNMTWEADDDDRPLFQFPPENHGFGGIFSLSPPEAAAMNPLEISFR